jgi:hypothetical protein
MKSLPITAVRDRLVALCTEILEQSRDITRDVINSKSPCPTAEWAAVGRVSGLLETERRLRAEIAALEQMLASVSHETGAGGAR